MTTVVTFDVFSALTNSRLGGSACLAATVSKHGWPVESTAVYDAWDSRNKELHRLEPAWRSFRDLSRVAFSAALESLGLAPDLDVDADGLLDSMIDWPLWPDVTPAAFAALEGVRPGLLTNIDDDLLAGTAVLRLGVFEPELVLTSQRLHSYKPAEQFYRSATAEVGPFVHVASSSRDVRGAGSAGLATIRLARPGHPLDPAGPAPRWTIESLAELPGVLPEAAASL